ncbi:YhcN/YlaJ family sporulation lipoprotein [Oceanobacillus halophilus]|uniref:YhcN/YlaJ family sporulation lipoprotein n=1 Tax=Oceanobacillus halophilus TaxID=930130 RepID=A0A494ZWZ3_9BACI|nr:YhcN/YlaJ family sporulation lipoprotein [Oceanobacillus halophilus]RKQ31242.1 YhcN/YlaJ family sporulation lipoprotein [Oceanobacillus halophilus]
MKKKLIAGAIVVSLALGGCQAAEEGASPNGAGNLDHARYGTDTGDGMTNVRNYRMQRDADDFQNRDARNINHRTNDRNMNNNAQNNNYTNLNQNRVNDNDNENRYEIASEAADKISDKVKEIDNVYVVTTDNNAYVAAELDTDKKDRNRNKNQNDNQNRFDDELSDKVKEEISDIVKSVDKDIDNVYVSTNPDFFDLTNNYVEDVDRGEPIEGFFDQFGNMIERLFPQNK